MMAQTRVEGHMVLSMLIVCFGWVESVGFLNRWKPLKYWIWLGKRPMSHPWGSHTLKTWKNRKSQRRRRKENQENAVSWKPTHEESVFRRTVWASVSDAAGRQEGWGATFNHCIWPLVRVVLVEWIGQRYVEEQMREENRREPNTQLLKGFLLHKERKKGRGKVVEKGTGSREGLWSRYSLEYFFQASGCSLIDKLERNGYYVLDVIFMKMENSQLLLLAKTFGD